MHHGGSRVHDVRILGCVCCKPPHHTIRDDGIEGIFPGCFFLINQVRLKASSASTTDMCLTSSH